MKTENIPGNRTVSYGPKDKAANDEKEQKARATEQPKTSEVPKEPGKRIELEKAVINNPEAVKKMIGDSIQWREMKFYQRQEGGQYYVDIVDKATGNVIRTIPDTKFAEIVENYKQLSGLKIDING